MNLTVETDEDLVVVSAARHILSLLAAVIARNGEAAVSLTGGGIAERLYHVIAGDTDAVRQIDWSKVRFFWGDERNVPPDNPDSNYGMALRALLDHLPVPHQRIHRMETEGGDPGPVARNYDALLRSVLVPARRGRALFDLMLLGVGPDAHIASIFPASELLRSPAPVGPSALLAAAVPAAHDRSSRVTLTPSAVLDAERIVVIVAGSAKADAVDAFLHRPLDVFRWPVQLLRTAADRLEWFMDVKAAVRGHDAPHGKSAPS